MNRVRASPLWRILPGVLCAWLLPASTFHVQAVIEGVEDREIYEDAVAFRVPAIDGMESTATLNQAPVGIGVSVRVDQPNYYDLRIIRTNLADGATTSERVRFIVRAGERRGTETGLPLWTPHPPIPSSAEEFAGSRLDLLMPSAFPQGFRIPVAAWVRRDDGLAVRANGPLTAPGQQAIAIRRGVGSGFLLAGEPPGALLYEPGLPGVQATRTVKVETNTTWTSVAGRLEGTADWGKDQRVHVTGELTIPADAELTIGAGTVVRVGPGVSITVDGRMRIQGTLEAPVVFIPSEPSQPWGGFLLSQNTSELIASAAIFTGSGADPDWITENGYSSHRKEECLLFCERAPRVALTDCAAFDLAGQFGHAVNGGTFELTRCLVQRCTTGGEFTRSTWTANDSAFIECPVDSPAFIDGDNDGLYLVSGTFSFTNTLFGWVKDDAIDCGASGTGTLNVQGCWFESVFHEALALSGPKEVTVRDSVFLDCGQGLEVGYGNPNARADHCLAVGNATGMRFGDSYDWEYGGFLTVTNSILIHNHRDVFGHTWNTAGTGPDTNQWVERVLQMDVRDNYLSELSSDHPQNAAWNGTAEGWRLAAFLTSALGARPGVGMALRAAQVPLRAAAGGIPVRLSSLSTNAAAVECVMEAPGGLRGVQRLEFRPGEIVRSGARIPAEWSGASVVRVSLRSAEGCEVSGLASVLLFDDLALEAKLGWAQFDGALVLYWNDGGSVLEWSPTVRGPWSPWPGQPSPVTVSFGETQRFYRLAANSRSN